MSAVETTVDTTTVQRLWSVTSLIKLGLGTSDPLVNWAVRTTAEYAVDQQEGWAPLARADRDAAIKVLTDARWNSSKKAAARGTDVHKAAEAMALGNEPPPIDDIIFPYVEQYRRWLDRFQPEFLMAEAPVYNPTFGYAGTSDGICAIDGAQVVFDLKTTPHAPDSGRSRPPFPEVALQMCAYARAEYVGLMSEQRYTGGKRYYVFNPAGHHVPLPPVDGALCIVVSPFDCVAVPVRIDEEVWTAFQYVMQCARWQVDISRNVFGPPISATAAEALA